ncbi:hypothetical protein ACTWKD_10360 [Halanaerobium saccharolyticum]|uniref:Lipoprotein n=1 Tax=Halanaerobium saccharolyticum TaxID=43595 RepID=A0A4R6RWF5_9FIRM|nr:hypothetical protein [Halanaerobium saccharolyticum]TDP91283.1 hypothetical protein C7957_11721 [Halanaerobium saccharolyticum]
MRKKLILVFIVLLGVVLLSGCSNDSDSLSDEAEITAVVEDFENDLNVLATAESSSDEYKRVDAGWDKDSKINLNFQGMTIEDLGLDQFKEMFKQYVNFDSLKILVQNINNNTAQVSTEIIYEVSAMNNGPKFFIDINLVKVSGNWYIDNFIIRPKFAYTLTDTAQNIQNSNIEVKLPESSSYFGWNEKSDSTNINLNLNSAYYTSTLSEAYFHSAILNSSAIVIDKGILNLDYKDISEIKNIQNHKEEVEKITQEILNSLYENEFGVEIVEYLEEIKVEDINNEDINNLVYDVQFKLNISSPFFLNTAKNLYADYKLRIAYKTDSSSNLYLGVYAAPQKYYEEEIAAELINSFKVIVN